MMNMRARQRSREFKQDVWEVIFPVAAYSITLAVLVKMVAGLIN